MATTNQHIAARNDPDLLDRFIAAAEQMGIHDARPWVQANMGRLVSAAVSGEQTVADVHAYAAQVRDTYIAGTPQRPGQDLAARRRVTRPSRDPRHHSPGVSPFGKERTMLYPNGTKTKPTVSSPFGPRKVTIPGASSNHQGVDFVGFRDIRAVLGGRVTHAGPLGGYGNAVAIDIHVTPELVITHLYGHLASVAVRVGQVVAEGAQLGVMGDTGTARGINLHFEVRHWRGKNLTCIDPLPYLESGVNPPAPKPAPAASKPAANNPAPNTMLKWRWTGIQRMLKGTGRYRGAIDNIPGPLTVKGFQAFVGVKQDGIFGPATCKAAQQWLKNKWGYAGAIDGIPGPQTKAAWDRAEVANGAAYASVR